MIGMQSTAGEARASDLSTAIGDGLAPDGGLYVPERLPRLEGLGTGSPEEVARATLSPFFAGDGLEAALPRICKGVFADPPYSLRELARNRWGLELFHGATAAFKDVGAGFLAPCLSALAAREEKTVLVATSGDTGSAVAAAMHRRKNLRLAILYPRNGVSPRQRHQLACWGDNVLSLAVDGNFDDCQALVKSAFNSEQLRSEFALTSANSINIGRLLPQVVYYVWAANTLSQHHNRQVSFAIPTGNLGNALACVYARQMGAPIADIVFACNANAAIPEWFASASFSPRPGIATLANAMDVGNPSNAVRLEHLLGKPPASEWLHASGYSDDRIRGAIVGHHRRYGEFICPHTATAWLAVEEYASPKDIWVAVATAHAAKFEGIVEPLLGQKVPVPNSLQQLLQRPVYENQLPAELGALTQRLRDWIS